MELADPKEVLAGWRTSAIIFGDMHVPVFCLFVCFHGQTLEPPAGTRFLGHIDLCLWELGLAMPKRTVTAGTFPSSEASRMASARMSMEHASGWRNNCDTSAVTWGRQRYLLCG
jgi:hypothetical protein